MEWVIGYKLRCWLCAAVLSLYDNGVVCRYWRRTCVITRIPTGIDESSAKKSGVWLPPEMVPGFCVPSLK